MKKPSFNDLSKNIENLIAAHMEQCRAATLEAVGRAFAMTSELRPPPVTAATQRKTGRVTPRRGREELTELSHKLYEQICASPGTTMAALAMSLQAPARTLQLPMEILKRDGRIRHVGQRSQMRYFPQSGLAALPS